MLDGRDADASTYRDKALRVFDDTGTALMSALIRLGTSEREVSEKWLRSEGVVDPARFASVLVPGLVDR